MTEQERQAMQVERALSGEQKCYYCDQWTSEGHYVIVSNGIRERKWVCLPSRKCHHRRPWQLSL